MSIIRKTWVVSNILLFVAGYIFKPSIEGFIAAILTFNLIVTGLYYLERGK